MECVTKDIISYGVIHTGQTEEIALLILKWGVIFISQDFDTVHGSLKKKLPSCNITVVVWFLHMLFFIESICQLNLCTRGRVNQHYLLEEKHVYSFCSLLCMNFWNTENEFENTF